MAAIVTSRIEIPESGDTFGLPIVGREVSRLILDFRLTFQFLGDDDDVDLTIATPFIINAGGRAQRLDPERPESLGPALPLLRQVIESATVDEGGFLEVVFAKGPALRVEPDPNYEAWQSRSSRGAMLICLPGGSLAVWDAHD